MGNLVPGPIEPATKRGEPGDAYSSATRRASDADGLRHLAGALRDAVLGQDDREPAEGVGLDDVDADVEEGAVQLLDERRAGDSVSASLQPFEGGAAEVVGVQVHQLEVGPGGPVVDEDPLAQRAQVGVVGARSAEGRARGGLH